jgi:hypothetical protein
MLYGFSVLHLQYLVAGIVDELSVSIIKICYTCSIKICCETMDD